MSKLSSIIRNALGIYYLETKHIVGMGIKLMDKRRIFLAMFSLLAICCNSFANTDIESWNKQSVFIQLTQIISNGEFDNNQLYNNLPSVNSPTSLKRVLPMPFIIGGTPVGRNTFPEYTLVIITDGRGNLTGLCGGTLIDSNKVLTAAHCSQNRASTYFLIPGFYSFNDRLEQSDLIQLSSVVDHPNYTTQGLDFDVAVMTLIRPVPINAAKVAKGSNQLVGEIGTVIGTGLTATTPAPISPDLLLGVDTPIISNEVCSESFLRVSRFDPITKNMLCAGFENSGEGSCSGDSGGPLFVGDGARRAISGVVSFGFATCEAQRATSVYARTTSFNDFIRQQSPDTQFVNFNVSLSPIYSLLFNDTSPIPQLPRPTPSPDNTELLEPSIESFDEGAYVIKLESTLGDTVGQGNNYAYTPLNSNIRFNSNTGNSLEIEINGWGSSDINATQSESWVWIFRLGQTIEPGSYTAKNSFNLDVQNNRRSCNGLSGEIRIFEIEYSGDTISKLVADFTQACQTDFGKLKGSIYYDSSNPDVVFTTPALTTSTPEPKLPELNYSGAVMVVESAPGAFIGSGQNYLFDRHNSNIRITNFFSSERGVRVNVEGPDSSWSLDLVRNNLDAAPDRLERLSQGVYEFAYSGNFDRTANTLEFRGGGGGCSRTSGQFRIFDISYDQNGIVNKLVADFLQRSCDNNLFPVRGSIAFDSTLPTPPPITPEAPTGIPVPNQAPLAVAGTSVKIERRDPSNSSTPIDALGFDVFNSNFNIFSRDDRQRIIIEFEGNGDNWTISFNKGTAITTSELVPGIYRNAANTFSTRPIPSMSFSGGNGGLNCFTNLPGTFTVYDIEFGENFTVTRLVADFERPCEDGSGNVIKGSIFHDENLDQAAFVPPQLPTGSPTPTLPGSTIENALVVVGDDASERLIGDQSFSFTNSNASFSLSSFFDTTVINVISFNQRWSIGFDKPRLDIDPDKNKPLQPGMYENAFGGSNKVSATLRFSANSTICDTNGSFNIYEIEYGSDGSLSKLIADFIHRCDTNTSAIRGSVRYISPP